jgi:hypothetical protein
MALSLKEQRLLAEIAAGLSQEDPAFAERIAAFARLRRRRRIRMVTLSVLGGIAFLVALVISFMG